MADLSAYDPDARCPKCRFDAITSTYGAGAHYECPLFDLRGWMALIRILGDVGDSPQGSGFPGEHIDRKCVRCSYAWAEAIPDD